MNRLEEGGWRDVYARCAPALHRLALRMLGREADAWDAVQEVFRRVLERPGAFRREAQPMTYLYRAMTNHCLNVQRAERRRPSAEPGATEDAAPKAGVGEALDADQLKLVEARALLARLAGALDDDLGRRALQIAVLHHLQGMTHDEIGAVVGLSRKWVAHELSRVAELAKRFAEEGASEVVPHE